MHKHKKNNHRVLSIYPTLRGYAFILFDSALSPHDWGTKEIKKDIACARTIESIKLLIARYRPDVLVLEDVADHRTKRSVRLKRIHKAIARVTEDLSIEIAVVSRKNVRATFAQFGAITKHDIAKVIASKIEAFAASMPRVRKAWLAEDRRMGLFDAASRALTYYYTVEQQAI